MRVRESPALTNNDRKAPIMATALEKAKTAKADQIDLSTVAKATLSEKIQPEQRYGIAQSGRAAAMWQAYALTASGLSIKDCAATLHRDQQTIRTHVWTVALALAMADVPHTETADGLPPAPVATFLAGAVEQVAAVQKVTKAEEPLRLAVDQAHRTRVTALTTIEGDPDLSGMVAEETAQGHEVPPTVASMVQASMAQKTKKRAEDLAKAKAEEQAKAAEQAKAQQAKAEQEGDESPKQRAARQAREEQTNAIKRAVTASDVDYVIGSLSLAVGTVAARYRRGNLRLTNTQADEVALLVAELQQVAGVDAMARLAVKIEQAKADKAAKQERAK